MNMNSSRRKSDRSKELYQLLQERGYSEPFASVITDNLNTDWTANRMIGYLWHYQQHLPEEEIVDEMLSILSDRQQIMQKKELEYNQSRINAMYRYGLGVEEDEDDEG